MTLDRQGTLHVNGDMHSEGEFHVDHSTGLGLYVPNKPDGLKVPTGNAIVLIPDDSGSDEEKIDIMDIYRCRTPDEDHYHFKIEI